MSFINQLEIHLDRLLGSSATKKQRAAATGIDYDYYVMIAAGKKNPPSDDKIVEAAKKLKLTDSETGELLLLAARDRAKEPATKNILQKYIDIESSEEKALEFVKWANEDHKIPIYTTIKAGNGEMGIMDGETDGDLTITEELLKQKVFAVRVSGDSMAPGLNDGDIAVFKPINGEPTRERDIYAVEVEGWFSWVVKHVRQDPSGSVLLISANSSYPVKEIDPGLNRVTLRGRLVESRRLWK